MNNKKVQLYFLISTYLINIILIIFVFAAAHFENYLNVIYTSDHVYAYSIFNDIINNKNSLIGWSLPGAPAYFPDMTIYFFIFLFTNKIGLTFIIYSIIQVVLLLLFFNLLIREIFPSINLNILSLSNLLFCLIYFITLLAGGKINTFTFHVIAITWHTGTVINTLMCLYLSFRYLKIRSWRILTILFIICLIGVLSDKIFVIYYIIPFFISYIILNNRRFSFTAIKLYSVLIFSVVLGIIIHNLLNVYIFDYGLNKIPFSFSKAIHSISIFGSIYKGLILKANLKSLAIIISALTFIGYSFLFIKNAIAKTKAKKEESEHFMHIYFLYFIILIPLAIISPGLIGRFNNSSDIRYFEIVFYFGVLNFFIVSFCLFSKKVMLYIANNFLVVLTVLILLYFFIYTKQKNISEGINKFLNYYPEFIEFIDNASEKYELKNGCSDHWNSKIVNVLSRKDVQIYTVFNSLNKYLVLSNNSWYFIDERDKNKEAVFNYFYVNKGFNRENIYKQFNDSVIEIEHNGMYLLLVPEFKFDKNGRILLK